MPKRRNPGAKRNPAASRSMKARTTRGTRRSPDRIAERSGNFSDGLSRYRSYNEMTYGKPDVASLGDPMSGWGGGVKAHSIVRNLPNGEAVEAILVALMSLNGVWLLVAPDRTVCQGNIAVKHQRNLLCVVPMLQCSTTTTNG